MMIFRRFGPLTIASKVAFNESETPGGRRERLVPIPVTSKNPPAVTENQERTEVMIIRLAANGGVFLPPWKASQSRAHQSNLHDVPKPVIAAWD